MKNSSDEGASAPSAKKASKDKKVVVLNFSSNPSPRPYTYFASGLGILMVSDTPLFRAKYPD